MTTNSILELTEKIYNEGIVKAKVEADQLIESAQEKAKNILSEANKQKVEIIETAHKKALEIEKNANSELQLAARQFTSALKQNIISSLAEQQSMHVFKESFNDIEFIKKIILTTIQNWNPQKPEELDIKILLPEKDKKQLTSFIENKTINTINKGVTFEFDSKTKKGFKIIPGQGNYRISFEEEDFENLFKNFFREKTKKLLFESK